MVNVVNTFITVPPRNMWLNLQKHGVLFASSVSFHEYGVLRTKCIWLLVCFCSHVSWLRTDRFSAELKESGLSSESQRASAREGPTAIPFPPTKIRCYYIVWMAFPLYRIGIIYKHHIASQRVAA